MRIRTTTATLLYAVILVAPRGAAGQANPPQLQVGADGRTLVDADARTVFLLGDTAWGLSWDLDRESVEEYLDVRRAQGFNAVAMVASGWGDEPNVYGDEPFVRRNGRPDPSQRAVTDGTDEGDVRSYDYWDHVDFCLDQAAARGMYVVLLPTWGEAVAGSWSGEDTTGIVFDATSAYDFGRWIGARYADRSNILWMLGGDRSPVYVKRDYRPVFRSMAEGVADGVNGDGAERAAVLMSYHPRKERPNSSHWFHRDDWLSFNSIQGWPDEQIPAVEEDWSRAPVKPTWLFEGRYEGFHRGGYTPDDWGAWQVRYQAYQTVFAGAFGHVYGHENVFGFEDGWHESAEAEGAAQMGYLAALMERWDGVARVPDQAMIVGDAGVTRRLESDRIQAMRGAGGELAMIYVANGREVEVRMDRLAGLAVDASWYDPRSGRWHGGTAEQGTPFAEGIASGRDAPVQLFDPPGQTGPGNDWVLVLERSR